MRLVLLGAPGSGKGTQGDVLAERLRVPHIASGELLRNATRTEAGREMARYLDRGELVPDDVVVDLMTGVLEKATSSGGYVLDGFPRNRAQAGQLESVAPPDAVVYLSLADHVARERMARRAKKESRSDDADGEVIERRLRLFHAETEPLLDFYRDRNLLLTVDASEAPDAVSNAILEALPSSDDRA